MADPDSQGADLCPGESGLSEEARQMAFPDAGQARFVVRCRIQFADGVPEPGERATATRMVPEHTRRQPRQAG